MILLQPTADRCSATEGQDAFFHYLPVDEHTASSELYLTGAGRVIVGPGEAYPPSSYPMMYHFEWCRGRTLPEYQLVFITGGGGEFDSRATGHVNLDSPTLLFLFPGMWHRYRPLSDTGWTERWFSFNGELARRLFAIVSFGSRSSVAKPHVSKRLASDFDEVLDMVDERSVQNHALLTFHFLRVLTGAIAQCVEFGTARTSSMSTRVDDPIVQTALDIIWSHGQYPISVGDIARQLPVTRRTLDRRFVEATGHSVLEEINVCRLSRAKRLLTETDQPIKTVAHLAGFSSAERMRVLFVEREGKSPSEYRKSALCARQGREGSVREDRCKRR